ncbi:MAG: hypothetical protein ACI9QD_001106, partial [Thermoproteota archaeon]
MSIETYFNNIEKKIGTAKFAVTIILLFAIILCIGTFVESYYGTEYANRLIYKSIPFMGLQLAMFLSIFISTLLRLPPKKRLYGFYTLHLGLLLLFIGSFVTYYAGIDGHLTLAPNVPSRSIIISDYIVKIRSYNKKGVVIGEFDYDLPYTAFKANLDLTLSEHLPKTFTKGFEKLKLKTYLPFSENEQMWIDNESTDLHSGNYHIFNDRFGQEFTLSLHPKSAYESTKSLGPLNIHYMPKNLARCFNLKIESKLIIWNSATQECFAPRERKATFEKTKSGNTLMAFKEKQTFVTFFPKYSPLPIKKDMKIDTESNYRVFSQKLFENKPHLFVFGDALAFYDKDEEKWFSKNFADHKNIIELPWMGFKVKLKKFSEKKYPILSPIYTTPIHDNGAIIKGNQKTLLVQIAGTDNNSEQVWLKEDKAVGLKADGRQLDFLLTKKTVLLPYEFNLDKFKMNKDPGTNTPASYESFVSLFTGNESSKHHIYMNNP